jgi:hypothetical protein
MFDKDNIMIYNDKADFLNNSTYTDYYFRLWLLATSVFEWENLPNNIDEKWIERFLFTEGKCIFYKYRNKGFMVAKCTTNGTLNPYDEPTHLMPVATNYSYDGKPLESDEECVVIRNNDLMLPTSYSIRLFAHRLTNITRAIDVNVNAQKTPYVIVGTDKQIKSVKTAYKQIDDNKPVVVVDSNFDTNNTINVLNTNAPVVFDKLECEKHQIWNECMTFLGVNNANQDKKERLVASEVEANNEMTSLNACILLKSRERAVKRINELWGTNINVKLRDLQTHINIDDESELPGSKGVKDNG